MATRAPVGANIHLGHPHHLWDIAARRVGEFQGWQSIVMSTTALLHILPHYHDGDDHHDHDRALMMLLMMMIWYWWHCIMILTRKLLHTALLPHCTFSVVRKIWAILKAHCWERFTSSFWAAWWWWYVDTKQWLWWWWWWWWCVGRPTNNAFIWDVSAVWENLKSATFLCAHFAFLP